MLIILCLFFSFILCNNLFPQANAKNPIISVRILDENGLPTPARIRFTGMDSTYFAPEGHKDDFPLVRWGSAGGDLILDYGKRYAYISGQFRILLPPERISVEVLKGFAYRIKSDTIQITPKTDKLDIRLDKWFSFPDKKWYSSDVHVHGIPSEAAILQMKAEDLNVCEILSTDVIDDQHRFTGKPDPVSDKNHIVIVNQEYREDRLGHMSFLNISQLIQPASPMRPYQYPLNMAACDEVHRQGGITMCAHFSQNQGFEWPLGVVMGKIDMFEVMCCILPFESQTSGTWYLIPDHEGNSGLRLWYRILNCGFKIPAGAGTDIYGNQVTLGANRVYAYVDDPFTYERWISALSAGRGFFTNSPFIMLDINGKMPGDSLFLKKGETLNIKAEVWCQFPLDYLEIISNGEVIAEKSISTEKEHSSLSVTFTPGKSCWITARAYESPLRHEKAGLSFAQNRLNGGGPTRLNGYFGTEAPEIPFSHTNPVYVKVDNKPIRSDVDARYYAHFLENGILYLKTQGKFPSEEAKQSVIRQFEEGRRRFLKLAEEN